MRYRTALKLHTGDEVTCKKTKTSYIVSSVENYKPVKLARINVTTPCGGGSGSFYHDEVK